MAPAFVTPTFVLGQSCRQSKTCHRRLVFTATAQGTGSSNWGNGSNSGGPSVPSGRIQTLEFTIRPGGTVEEKVLGIKGKHCEKITEKIEQAIGPVLHTEKTEEYFEVVHEELKDQNVLKEGVQWPGAEGLPTW